VTGWLGVIITNEITLSIASNGDGGRVFWDIALCDFGLMMAAFVLARLAAKYALGAWSEPSEADRAWASKRRGWWLAPAAELPAGVSLARPDGLSSAWQESRGRSSSMGCERHRTSHERNAQRENAISWCRSRGPRRRPSSAALASTS
jgi:hypothetical protein